MSRRRRTGEQQSRSVAVAETPYDRWEEVGESIGSRDTDVHSDLTISDNINTRVREFTSSHIL